MGSILLRKRSVDFQTLENIAFSCRVAFEKQLDSVFDAYLDRLSELEAMRNLFAYRGGIADQRFIQRTRKVAGFENLKDGSVVILTGIYVADKADVISKCSTALVTGVDDWIVGQKR